nr:hypothetical protein [Helicobacter bizzozeronii]
MAHCVFASEINPCAQKTYQLNFPKTPPFWRHHRFKRASSDASTL